MARRILVVEDEAPIREMVCFVLEQNGFQPVEAEDYDSAVNQLNEPWPDLILLDWMLPGGSGIQFIKHLKRESMTRDIPVVMLTARLVHNIFLEIRLLFMLYLDNSNPEYPH